MLRIFPEQPDPQDARLQHRIAEAVACVRRGFSLVPCDRKKPTVKGWTRLPKTTEAEAREYAQKGNFGIRTGVISNIVVIDVDPAHGGNGSLAALNLPKTASVRTGSGGRHFYFKYPIDGLRNSAGKLAPGIDIRADGGQVIAPPSIHPDTGQPYQWELSPEDYPLADFPETILEKLRHGSPEHGAPSGVHDRIPEGQRNSELTSLAGSMRRRGMSQEAITAALLAENKRRCDPPLSRDEVIKIAQSVSRYPASTGGAQGFHLTDLGNAKRLVATHGDNIRFCYGMGKWLIWDGQCWKEDETNEIFRLAKGVVLEIYVEAASVADDKARNRLIAHAVHSESENRLRAMVSLAQSEKGIPIRVPELDLDPMILNCLNGVIDLRTGALRPHRWEDLLTKITAIKYDPDAPTFLWDIFLDKITAGNKDLIEFLRRAIAYALTGDLSEQCLFLLYGLGANGKSTLIQVLQALFGDYAQQAAFETFLAKDHGGIPNDLARLKGARFVAAVEADAGRRMAESTIKQVTGGDLITARFLHKEFFEYTPQFKLWLACNHKPVIRGTDHAMWRRIKLIPFTVQIPEAECDPKMAEKLKAELPGILAWAVKGCIDWQKTGLGMPQEVKTATAEYRADMDILGDFFDECCVQKSDAVTLSKDLYQAYTTWAGGNGEKPMSMKTFTGQLSERGFTNGKTWKGRHWEGIGLKTMSHDGS